MHTRVQGTLVKELVEVLPEGSQLWVTTHSLGVLRAAQEMSAEKPGSVCVIDFDSIDPDIPRDIVPSSLGRVSWEKLLSIALDDLSQRVAPCIVVICEGSSVGNRRKDFDAEIYNRILGSQMPGVLFVSGGSSSQVAATGISIRQTLSNILPSAKILALCDRDDKSQAEVAQFECAGNIVLPERNLESYLFADDIIKALVIREGKDNLLPDALKVKADAVANSVHRGNAPDDLKSAAGEIYTNMKRLLGLQRCGNNTETFMWDTLAPLVIAPMTTYQALKAAILDRIA